ncbi:response regulator, partial [bacterium]|nr:response regulator [bacterium]
FHDYGYARIPFWHAYFPYSKLSTRLLQGLMILFGILFADSSFKQFSPPSLVRNIYKSFFVIVSIATLATPFIQNWKMLILFLYATLALLLVTITVSIFLIYKRQYAAFYLLFGWIFVAVGAFTYFLTSTGYLPHTFYTTHSMQMGASLGFVIFALSLTNNLKQSINKKLEEKEVALDSMKTAQNLLEQFVQAISHEIRTPLNGIVGNISLIHPTSPQQQTVLNSLENESTRLATLLSSILDINALLEQTDDKQAHYFNATDLLQEVIRLMTHFIQKNNNAITLEQNVDSCIIEGKKPLFIKILIGLIFNVIHHAKSSAILLRITEEGGKCTITVRDDGCGIAPDTLQNIQQIIDNPPAPKTGQNTMTRVSISEIVHLSKKLHGQIKIFSELGRGTTAVLTFPTAPVSIVKQLEKTPAFQYKTGHKNGRTPILIVDDEPINLRILTAFLEQEKYTVEIASNGEETIKSLAKATPGLILMDVMLPDISGIELVKEIRKEHDKLALPILFVSARSDIKTLKNAYQNGGNGFIVKPIDRHALMYQVEMWFELSRTHKQNYE